MDWTTVVVSMIGSSGVSGLVGTMAGHRAADAAQTKNHRRDQIAAWRQMIVDHQRDGAIRVGADPITFEGGWQSLRGYLPDDLRDRYEEADGSVQVSIGGENSLHHKQLSERVSELEADWGLA